MRCPVCQLELGVERQAGEVVLTYSFKDWAERCTLPAGRPGAVRQPDADHSGDADAKQLRG